MRSNPEGGGTTLIGRVPFVLVLTGFVVKGAVFLILNGGILLAALKGEQFPDLATLWLKGTICPAVQLMKTANGFASLTLLLALCAVVGLVLAPFDALLCSGFTWLATLIWRRLYRGSQSTGRGNLFFSVRAVVDSEYVLILSSLFREPQDKAHWEWELFLYYIYWGIFANVFSFFLLSIALLRSTLTLRAWSALVLVVLYLLWNALLHSRVMERVHHFYLERADRALNAKQHRETGTS